MALLPQQVRKLISGLSRILMDPRGPPRRTGRLGRGGGLRWITNRCGGGPGSSICKMITENRLSYNCVLRIGAAPEAGLAPWAREDRGTGRSRLRPLSEVLPREAVRHPPRL